MKHKQRRLNKNPKIETLSFATCCKVVNGENRANNLHYLFEARKQAGPDPIDLPNRIIF